MSDHTQADAGRERDPIPTARESDQDRQALSAPWTSPPAPTRTRPPAPPPCRAAPPACAWTLGASAAPTAWIPCASVSWKRWSDAAAACRRRPRAAGPAPGRPARRLRGGPGAGRGRARQPRARAVASAWPRGAGLRRRRYAHRRPCPPTPWPAWPARSTPATPCPGAAPPGCRCWTCTAISGPRSVPTASCANRNSRCPTMPARSIPTTWSTARLALMRQLARLSAPVPVLPGRAGLMEQFDGAVAAAGEAARGSAKAGAKGEARRARRRQAQPGQDGLTPRPICAGPCPQ